MWRPVSVSFFSVFIWFFKYIALVLMISLHCRRILGGRKLLVYGRIVIAAIFDFKIEEAWGE